MAAEQQYLCLWRNGWDPRGECQPVLESAVLSQSSLEANCPSTASSSWAGELATTNTLHSSGGACCLPALEERRCAQTFTLSWGPNNWQAARPASYTLFKSHLDTGFERWADPPLSLGTLKESPHELQEMSWRKGLGVKTCDVERKASVQVGSL